jgi:hypothetical protein
MFCPKCAAPNQENAAYCRICGLQMKSGPDTMKLNGYAIAKFIIGDAFVLPAILLMALDSSVQTPLWLLLAVPGLLLYTWAAVDLVHAQRLKPQRMDIADKSSTRELGDPMMNNMASNFASRKDPVSVTEHTTESLR